MAMSDMKNYTIPEDKSILCAANSYISKFYLNPSYEALPKFIKEELQKLCVSLTEEAGGIAVMSFDEDGELSINSFCDEKDYYYDNVSAGLLVHLIERENKELFHNLCDYYRMKFLGLAPLYEEEE